MAKPPIKLSRLRDIGWAEWDPIGLRDLDGGWETSKAADEYDGYLREVAGMLRANEPEESAVDYLVWGESEHMGAGIGPTTRLRATATVRAIKEYLNNLSNES
jgi:hypothetical protein